MRHAKNRLLTQLLVGGCLLALIMAILVVNPTPQKDERVLPVAQAPAAAPPSATGTTAPHSALPAAIETGITTPIPTPPTLVPTTTPLPAVLQPATALTATLTVAPASVLTTNVTLLNSGNSTEPLHALIWAPTGDKLVYVTSAGKLYWSNLDGSSATLLLTYDPNNIWSLLDEQRPMTNTLFLPGYLLRFTTGQAPVLQAAPATAGVSQFRWWSADRVSGIAGGPSGANYVGGNMLVTFDANGNLVDQRNIPYMAFGAVQPGGQWLAYVTDQQATSTPFYGSDPQTVYLLNLQSGQRLRVTPPGIAGWGLRNWSPDGNWFLMSADVDQARKGVIVSANGQQWIAVTSPGADASDGVWSPDSRKFAFSEVKGGNDEPNQPPDPFTTTVYIFSVPSSTTSSVGTSGPGANLTAQLRQPRWSPDGTRLLYLALPPPGQGCYGVCQSCPPSCSATSPAFYIVPAP